MSNNSMVVNDANITSRCRARIKPGVYLILPSENRVFSYIPGFENIAFQILATPQLGAKFLQYELLVHPNGGVSTPYLEHLEQFYYVLEGNLEFEVNGTTYELERGSFCWLPPHQVFRFRNRCQQPCRLVWIRKHYQQIEGIAIPDPIISHESNVPAYPTDTYMEKHLTPYEDLRFDMGINLQEFEPGVYFSEVESHIMEHGLYMLSGRGIYWLNGDFIEVKKNDFIYMAPYCPQFFYTTGWEKAAYLLYKDVNRDYTLRNE
jgi:(S)-ureidoglycine aminohydrolase